MIPFQRDSMFVGREGTIAEIGRRLQAIGHQHDRTALVGLAGVG